MTDISKCQGLQCDKRESCWRFTAPAGIWQSWMSPEFTGDRCEYYWPIAPSKPSTSLPSGDKP